MALESKAARRQQQALFKQIHQYELSLKLAALIRDGLSRKTVDACFKAARSQKENAHGQPTLARPAQRG